MPIPPHRSESGAEWHPTPTPAERAAELCADQRVVARAERRAYALAIFGCLFSMSAGLFLIGWSLHTTNDRWAGVAFWGGLVVGYGGITITLAGLYRKHEESGW